MDCSQPNVLLHSVNASHTYSDILEIITNQGQNANSSSPCRHCALSLVRLTSQFVNAAVPLLQLDVLTVGKCGICLDLLQSLSTQVASLDCCQVFLGAVH